MGWVPRLGLPYRKRSRNKLQPVRIRYSLFPPAWLASETCTATLQFKKELV